MGPCVLDRRTGTRRMLVERASTRTPSSRTTRGSRGTAAWTRLLTLMAAWSGFVPMANVTVIMSMPASLLVDSR